MVSATATATAAKAADDISINLLNYLVVRECADVDEGVSVYGNSS